MYGYYGRTASPPPVARGAWSATPGPQHSVDGGLVASPAAPLPSAAGALGVAVSSEGDASKGEEDEAFVPDFGVPLGVAVPPTVRQHMMIVGTARTTVRSPQVRTESGTDGSLGLWGRPRIVMVCAFVERRSQANRRVGGGALLVARVG